MDYGGTKDEGPRTDEELRTKHQGLAQLAAAFSPAAGTRTASLTLSLTLPRTAAALPRAVVAMALSLLTALAGTSRSLPGARSAEALTLTG